MTSAFGEFGSFGCLLGFRTSFCSASAAHAGFRRGHATEVDWFGIRGDVAGTGGMGAFGGMTSCVDRWSRCIVIDFGKRRHFDCKSNEGG